MRVNDKNYRTVWMQENTVFLINQNLLPFRFELFESSDWETSCMVIQTMIVRGAGAIGATAGFAMAQAALQAPEADYINYLLEAKTAIEATRPTAQNLFAATARVHAKALISRDEAVNEAQQIAQEDLDACMTIGKLGNTLIPDQARIETHCNAGWLAFVDHGSALSPIYEAAKQGKKPFVLVDETRPRSQGARLTAWELFNEHIQHRIIADNAGAHYMSHGMVDLMIVGADRIAANGDVANKIGTLEKAIVAKEYGIPFYVAAPSMTIDWLCATGVDIPIEERSEEEVLFQTGINKSGELTTIQVASPESEAWNPAFDVTPAHLIHAIITEKGIFKPSELNRMQ